MLGFLGGAAKGAQNELQDQDKRAFALKLQNAQIEGQIKSMMAEHDYKKASAKTTESIFKDSNMEAEPGQRESIAELGLLAGKQKAEIGAEAKAARERARATRPQITRVGNQVVGISWERDPNTGQLVPNKIPIGADPSSYRKYSDFSAMAESAYSRIDNIRSSAKNLLSDKNILMRFPKMASMTLDNLTGSGDPDVATLVSSLDANALAIAAVINHGRPSDPDKEAVKLAMPRKRDSLTIALRKLDDLESIMSRTEKRSYDMLINGEMDPPREDKNKEKKGMHTIDEIDAELIRQGIDPKTGKPLAKGT